MATWQKILIGIGAMALLAGLFFGGRCSAPTPRPERVEVEVTREVKLETVVEQTVVVEKEVEVEKVVEREVVVAATAQPTPKPIAAAVQPKDQPGHTLAYGEEWEVPSGWCCSGDILVWDGPSWQKLYDSGFEGTQWTGLVTCFQQKTKAQAPYGAYCDPDDGWQLMKKRLEVDGCESGKGCSGGVTVINWPTDPS